MCACACLCAPQEANAQGGPPLLTDDPDTPGPRHWELNVSFISLKTAAGVSTDTPRFDLNYGVGKRIQLKFEAPVLVVNPEGEPTETAAGTAAAGVKWRFLGQEGRTLAWSVYPQFEFNLGSSASSRGLVEPGWRLVLPTEITLELGKFEINTEMGYERSQHGDNTFILGAATEASIKKKLELLLEGYREQTSGQPAVVIINAGARQHLTRQLTLLFAIGRGVGKFTDERPDWLVHLALQFNLPDRYVLRRQQK